VKVRHYLLAVAALAALATPAALAEEAAGPVSKETGTAGPSGNAGGPQGSSAGAVGGAANATNRGAVETGLGANGGAKDSGASANPIDTSISVQSSPTTKKSMKASDRKNTGALIPSVNFRDRRQTSAPGSMGGIVRNAIGAPAKNAADAKRPETGRPGIGPAANNAAAKIPVGNSVATGSVGGPTIGARNPGPVYPAKTALNHATINGTGMGRLGSGPATVGGPAKNVAGINGTGVRPRH
jgi:hypothetical protein